ncbi:heat shock protein 90-1-like [Juglans microcarpa x Juglans regia]|uniref:heat shock protein 90-1-like n=1 Tax=Juglans microcarpa x Juglans regia TaxID=2249226 RepID=UPI001B7ED5AD|nr:heat shock protein 90-1-like [Juglans microcarpa x Juglans regia]
MRVLEENKDHDLQLESVIVYYNRSCYDHLAKVNQILSLIIGTFYSNKEIFFRERAHNSSNALDKIQFEGLTYKNELVVQPELFIRVILNKVNKTLSIIHRGIDMTKTYLGTKDFMEVMQARGDVSMIG